MTGPHATLVARGLKRLETRGRRTRVRGLVAIHAGERFGPEERAACARPPIAAALARAGIARWEELDFGAVIGVVRLVACWAAEAAPPGLLTPLELAAGDFGAGRFAWWLDDARRLVTPVETRGWQGWWWWEAPAGLALEPPARRPG